MVGTQYCLVDYWLQGRFAVSVHGGCAYALDGGTHGAVLRHAFADVSPDVGGITDLIKNYYCPGKIL